MQRGVIQAYEAAEPRATWNDHGHGVGAPRRPSSEAPRGARSFGSDGHARPLLARAPAPGTRFGTGAAFLEPPLLRTPQLEIAACADQPPRIVPTADPELTTSFLAAYGAWIERKRRFSHRRR